jgi:hypothetical protein
MWIIIDRGHGTEPIFQDFGDAASNGNGIFIFTDPGEERVERTVLGATRAPHGKGMILLKAGTSVFLKYQKAIVTKVKIETNLFSQE